MVVKEQIENKIVKESMLKALLKLMEKKHIHNITITELCRIAGVSRMAYYRNYTSLEGILIAHLDDLFDQYTSKVLTNKNNVLHASRLYFKFFRSQKNLLNILIMRKQSDLLGAHYEAYLELLLKDLDYTKREDVTLESYVVTFIAAGLHKILIKWAQNGMVESDQTMAKLVEGLFEAAFDFKTDRKS